LQNYNSPKKLGFDLEVGLVELGLVELELGKES